MPAAAVHRLPPLAGEPPVVELVRVGVADPAGADALEQPPILAPMQVPVAHVMVARVVDHTASADAVVFVVDVAQREARVADREYFRAHDDELVHGSRIAGHDRFDLGAGAPVVARTRARARFNHAHAE